MSSCLTLVLYKVFASLLKVKVIEWFFSEWINNFLMAHQHITGHSAPQKNDNNTRMCANAQRDGRPAEYRWCPVLNAAKFG